MGKNQEKEKPFHLVIKQSVFKKWKFALKVLFFALLIGLGFMLFRSLQKEKQSTLNQKLLNDFGKEKQQLENLAKQFQDIVKQSQKNLEKHGLIQSTTDYIKNYYEWAIEKLKQKLK